MKKIFAAACSMALVFGLAGCGSSSAENTTEAPEQVQGLTDEASVAKARELMEAMLAAPVEDNMTEIDTVRTVTNIDGQDYDSLSTVTIMKDTAGDVPAFYKKIETNPAAETDATYYVKGSDGVIEMDGEMAQVEFDDEQVADIFNVESNSEGSRTYYDCADEISYYEEDGTQVVMLKVDPEKLMESGVLSETFSNIDSCVAEYTFNADGKLSFFISTIEGTLVGTDGEGVPATVEAKCIYSDYGTTEVPALPEVVDGVNDEGNTEQTDEVESGE